MKTANRHSFESASQDILRYLHAQLGFGLWMVTRVEGESWIVLTAEDHEYDVQPGSVFRWTDSLCSQMVKGNGPRIAPDATNIPAYAAAPISHKIPIRAYIGMPLTRQDGSLFGTLCAIDPSPQPEALCQQQGMIELFASLLSTILIKELKIEEEERRIERLEIEAHSDGLTGLLNRRAWDLLLEKEEARAKRYGAPSSIAVIDLDQLKLINDQQGHDVGDTWIRRAASALQSAARSSDIVARLGGDEFGIIFVECDAAGARILGQRVRSALQAEGIAASLGIAARSSLRSLKATWKRADELMYEDKRKKNGH